MIIQHYVASLYANTWRTIGLVKKIDYEKRTYFIGDFFVNPMIGNMAELTIILRYPEN